MKLTQNSKALLIFDVFKGLTTGTVNKSLEDNHCLVQQVPYNHTNLFQSLDISVNKGAKSFLPNKYQDLYASQVSKQLERDAEPHDVTLTKPLHAEWVMDYHK